MLLYPAAYAYFRGPEVWYASIRRSLLPREPIRDNILPLQEEILLTIEIEVGVERLEDCCILEQWRLASGWQVSPK